MSFATEKDKHNASWSLDPQLLSNQGQFSDTTVSNKTHKTGIFPSHLTTLLKPPPSQKIFFSTKWYR